MTRMTERHRLMANIGLAVASAALAVPAALAHGGYGPGYGVGCGAGYGQACVVGDGPGYSAGYGPGECGARPGMRQGMEPGYGPGGGGVGLLTEEERAAHRAKMQSLASYDECKMYMTDFNKQIHARAKEKGQTVVGPNDAMCDRMKAHGRFTQ